MNYVLTHLYSHIVYKKKQQLLLTPLKKPLAGLFRKKDIQSYMYQKIDSSGAKLLEHRAGSTGNCFCAHKVEAIPSWKTIYPTHWPQTTQISLCTRRGDPEDSISENYKMGNSSNGLRLWVNVHIRGADTSCRCFEQNGFDEDESDNDRVCFAINNVYFAQSDLVTQAENKTELGTNRLFLDIMKRIKSGSWKQCSVAEKAFEQQKDAHTLHNGIIFRSVVPFIPPKLRHLVLAKAHETHPGKNSTESPVRMIAWWSGITQDVQHVVSKCMNCQLNRPSLEKNSLYVARSRRLGTAPDGPTGVMLRTKSIS